MAPVSVEDVEAQNIGTVPHFLRRPSSVRSERRRASGGVEERAPGRFAGLRLRYATLRPNGNDLTASEEVHECHVV